MPIIIRNEKKLEAWGGKILIKFLVSFVEKKIWALCCCSLMIKQFYACFFLFHGLSSSDDAYFQNYKIFVNHIKKNKMCDKCLFVEKFENHPDILERFFDIKIFCYIKFKLYLNLRA